MDVRLGIQTPTQSFLLPYEMTKGQEAVDYYNKTGKTAYKWQEMILENMMAINDEGLWVHTKFGYSVPRRNGKNECIIMRELWGLLNNEKIMHTAHRTTTAHSAWERLIAALEAMGFAEDKDFDPLQFEQGHPHADFTKEPLKHPHHTAMSNRL